MRVVACVAFICALVLASCHQKITAEVEAGYQECRMALLLGNIYIALEESGNTSQELLVEMMKDLVKPFGLPVNESTSVSSGEDGVGVRVSSSFIPDLDKLYKVTDFVEPVLMCSMCLFIALFLTQMVLRIGNCITMVNRYRYGKPIRGRYGLTHWRLDKVMFKEWMVV